MKDQIDHDATAEQMAEQPFESGPVFVPVGHRNARGCAWMFGAAVVWLIGFVVLLVVRWP